MDCFRLRSSSFGGQVVARAPRNDAVRSGYNFAFSRHGLPEVCKTFSLEEEGAGDTGCALHPRSRVQLCEKLRTRAYRFSGNTPASPTQWLYGLCRDLLGDEFLFVTVAAGLRPKRSGRIASATDNLASATDAGTTRFCRTQP